MTGALTCANLHGERGLGVAVVTQHEQAADEIEELGVQVGPGPPGGGDRRRDFRPVGKGGLVAWPRIAAVDREGGEHLAQ